MSIPIRPRVACIAGCLAAFALPALGACSSSSGGKSPASDGIQDTSTTILAGLNTTVPANGPASSYPPNPAPPPGNGGATTPGAGGP